MYFFVVQQISIIHFKIFLEQKDLHHNILIFYYKQLTGNK